MDRGRVFAFVFAPHRARRAGEQHRENDQLAE
jgi:hypothetical protein